MQQPPAQPRSTAGTVGDLPQQRDERQAILDRALSLETLGREHWPAADRLFADLVDRHPGTPQARAAEAARTRLAQANLRCFEHGDLRPEVVGYIAAALRDFARLGAPRRDEIALEIALLGRDGGLDLADPAPKYSLRSMPGRFCGLQLLAIMYAAFRQIDPTIDVGADFLREYELARGTTD